MTDRMDDLLDAYLDSGELPVDASVEEREQLVRMESAAGVFSASRIEVEAEARSAKPVAKARFERFMAANQPAPAAPAQLRIQAKAVRPSWFGRMLQLNRGIGAVAAAAVIGVFALIAMFTLQNASDVTETAAAQVLAPGDYAQVYGTVSSISGAGDDTTLLVDSEFGTLEVSVSDSTSVVESNVLRELASIQPGESLLIAGLVQQNRIIAANTLALAGANATPAVTGVAVAKDLKRAAPLEFDGRITLITLAKDGIGARVVVAVADGTRYTVRIDRRSAGALLALDRVIGEMVHLVHIEGDRQNVYVVQVRATPAASPSSAASRSTPAPSITRPGQAPAATPAPVVTRPAAGFVNANGVITGRQSNVFSIQTASGLLAVVIRPDTQVIFGESGLTLPDILRGETVIGHSVRIQGGIERATGRVIADVLIVGPKP